MALAGCSSSGASDSATSPAATGGTSSAAPSSAAPSSTAPSTSASSSSQSSAGQTSGQASDSDLTALAGKLGCQNPAVQSVKKTAPGYKMGVRRVLQCKVGSKEYFMAAATEPQQKLVANSFMASGDTSGKMSYVSAPSWMIIGGEPTSSQPPTKDEANQIQAKVGGTVKTVG